MDAEWLTRTDAVTVRRKPERADYRRERANAILDEALVAHVGICVDGQPYVIPMAFGRDGNHLVLHGSRATRLLRTLADGNPACVTVTLIDAVVLARSQFHTSMNYRAVVIIGTPRVIHDLDEKRQAMKKLVDHVVPGRTREARPPTDDELRQITAIEIDIDTASVKVRTGGPLEEPEDLNQDAWAGLVPVTTAYGNPIPEPDLRTNIPLPTSVSPYVRPRAQE
jgi:nitroimidazol reductase NimA-like FMN-containing flavoprotein (pyridoxamine 5'-phosphate oxidase superfamily)